MKDKVLGTLQMSFEEYLNQVKKTEKEIKDSFLEEAQDRIKQSLVLKEISDKEKIIVSEEEIKNETEKILKNYPLEKTKDLDLKKLKLYIEGEIRNEKTFQFLEKLAQNI
jgi:FKBP-type peptidyl-prolyl cis-trans isomerase (trigger factor)